jgi:DNA invertase Pin-like site-specific DNA recombinase
MRIALYARVSTERQQERGTVGSQLDALRAAARADGHEVIEEFVDAGYSGARLDRPALDRLRDAAQAGVLDAVLCLCVDRLARAYAYQVLILEELERFGVTVRFLEGPSPSDDPQATLLIQMQGVIAEYEKAKVAERKSSRQALPRPRRRNPVLESLLRVPPSRRSRSATIPDRGLRTRGPGRARDLRSIRRAGPVGSPARV